MKSPKSLFAAIAMSTICAGNNLNAAIRISDVDIGSARKTCTSSCGTSSVPVPWSGSITVSDPDAVAALPGYFGGSMTYPFSYRVSSPGLDFSPHFGFGGGSTSKTYYLKFLRTEVRDYDVYYDPVTGQEILLPTYTVLSKTYSFVEDADDPTPPTCKPGE